MQAARAVIKSALATERTTLASLTARVFQSLLGVVASANLARDEATLRKAVEKGRRADTGQPPPNFYKACQVEVREVGGSRIFTARPKGGGPVRGHVLYLHGGGYVNGPACTGASSPSW